MNDRRATDMTQRWSPDGRDREATDLTLRNVVQIEGIEGPLA
jgi:hypothetical protein